jgi:hypothetical protein
MEKAMASLLEFRDRRDWAQFHNPKDLAIAISTESSELLSEFLWKTPEQVNVENVKDEIADVLSYCLLLCKYYALDPETIILEKVARNEIRYPVDKSKGSSKKYNEF